MIKFFLKQLANLKLAIFLLLLIAFSSSLGSIIEQDKEIEFYLTNYEVKIKLLGLSLGEFLLKLELNHIYTTWWFFFILVLFGLCLLSCTFLQQFPALKFARRYYFYKQNNLLSKCDYKFDGANSQISLFTSVLGESQYSIFQQKQAFYANKGLISRTGPIVVHISIISVLIGSILGAIVGFNAQEFVPKTEIFHLQNVVKNGVFSFIPQKSFRVNDFWSTYTEFGVIKQFHSDLSVLNGHGKEILRQTLYVNKPLHFHGLTLYQTDWGVTGVRLQILKKKLENIQIPLSQTLQQNQKIWITWLPIDNKGIILLLSNDRGQFLVYDETGHFLNRLNVGESINFKNALKINCVDLIVSSGIQIKSDPGLFMIYFGFFSLIISSFISYISFSELWIVQQNFQLFCGGKTNRAQVKFQIEMAKLAEFQFDKSDKI